MSDIAETLRAIPKWCPMISDPKDIAACEAGAAAWEQLQALLNGKAWVLIERPPAWTTGKERIEGIAITNADASEFVRCNCELGYARSSLPFKVISHPLVTAQEKQP